MTIQEQAELKRGAPSHETPTFDKESVIGATRVLIGQLDGLRQFADRENLDTSMEILTNLLVRVPPTEEIRESLTDFVTNVPDKSNEKEKRHYVRMLRFLAPFVDSASVLNGLNHAKRYPGFNKFKDALPILIQLDDKSEAISAMQTLAKNTNRWSREFVSVATVFEGLAYIHNEDAVTMLQEGLTITNQKMETIERKSAYTAKDGDDMHAYSYIRESIISALAHNNDPHALAVLTQELEIVTNQIVDYKEANKRVFEVNHTTNLLEIVRALMAKADGRAA